MAIITISRQTGSLGDEIARGLAEKLDYKLVSRTDFRELAGKYNDTFEGKLKKIEREEGPGFWERLLLSTPVYLSLYEAFIYELASQLHCIILGRGAQIVLRDVHQVYRVRVVAPTHARVIHLRQVHGMSTDEALEFIRSHDHKRRNLIRQIYDRDPRDWSMYDMILNTARLDVEAGINLLTQSIEEVTRLQPAEEVAGILTGLALGKRVEAKLRQEIKPTLELEALGEADGTVTLMGSLASGDDNKRAEELAGAMEGVTKVINKIRYPVFMPGY